MNLGVLGIVLLVPTAICGNQNYMLLIYSSPLRKEQLLDDLYLDSVKYMDDTAGKRDFGGSSLVSSRLRCGR